MKFKEWVVEVPLPKGKHSLDSDKTCHFQQKDWFVSYVLKSAAEMHKGCKSY